MDNAHTYCDGILRSLSNDEKNDVQNYNKPYVIMIESNILP